MIAVSSLLGVRRSASDALRYGRDRPGERVPPSSAARRPVVVWNVTRACNLACRHCYASAKRLPARGELSNDEARRFLDDLAGYGVPAVLVSGGEPLSRPDLLDLIGYGTGIGLRFTLSTNGTLIDRPTAHALERAGLVYAGVSIDGPAELHDRLRCQQGAWDASLDGIRNLAAAGVRRGVRFTLTPQTLDGLDRVLELVEQERIERFCLYHLVPSGRGRTLDDVTAGERRSALERVFSFADTHPEIEVLTVDNPSDGPALLRWLEGRDRERAVRCGEMLAWNAGARFGPGVALANVDELGDVHPDQFSRHHTVGNVRRRPFSEIWGTPSDQYLISLRTENRPLPARCAACAWASLCGGGFRARAELATGDPWAFDPSCSLPAPA
ncbi:MAG TPA: radical SAM protein [Gaiellales bacterium]|nr:radical SAM protein [Gaiellales bacterium]